MEFTSGQVGRVVFIRWHATPVLASSRVIERLIKDAHKSEGALLHVVMIYPQSTGVPEGQVREELMKTIREIDPFVESYQHVIEGSGFRDALVRSTLTTIGSLMVRQRGKVFIHKTVDEAITALRTRHKIDIASISRLVNTAGFIRSSV